MFLLTLIYFWPQLVGGKVLFWGDIGLYFTPMQTFLHDNLRLGRLPLWNPLILCGEPYVGNPQTWVLYPFTALLPFMPAPQFLDWTIAFHVWLAGLGAFLFFRRTLPIGTTAALLGAIVFMFGGQLISKEQFPNMVQAAAYLPWILWRVTLLLEGWRGKDALWLGLVLGLQLLAAHAQITLLTLYLSLAWGVFLSYRQASKVRLSRALQRLALAGLIAAGIAMGQVLPALDLFIHAARQNLRFGAVNRFYLPPGEITNLILPTLRGHPTWGNFTGRGNFWETCCYVGAIPFALALIGGLFGWRRAPVTRFWTGVFAFGLVMALGGNGGLYFLAYYLLPGFRNFHDPARCLLWATFALSALAALGGERVMASLRNPPRSFLATLPKREGEEVNTSHLSGITLSPPVSGGVPEGRNDRRGRGVLLLLLAFVDLAHFGRTIYPLADAAELFPTPPVLAAVQNDPDVRAGQARVLAPDTKRVWQQFTGWRTYRQTAPGFHALWADTLASNLGMAYGLRDAYGYEPVALENSKVVTNAASLAFGPEANSVEKERATAVAGSLGVGQIATYRIVPPEQSLPGLAPLQSEATLQPGRAKSQTRVYLSRNLNWQPRARIITEFAAYSTPAEARTAMGLEKHSSGEVRLSGKGSPLTPNSGGTGEEPTSPFAHSSLRVLLPKREEKEFRKLHFSSPSRFGRVAISMAGWVLSGSPELGARGLLPTIITGAVPFASVPGTVSEATIVSDSPDLVVVEAVTATPALLVLADTDASGWRATVDGSPAPILSADGCLRAVVLARPGAHRVTFAYRPFAFQLGLYLSLLTVGFLCGAAVFYGARKKPREDFGARASNSAV